MYYEYWGLKKPPFDNVPDPSMYVECHASMENAIAETLFAIEEGGESIAVIIGDVGLGKTLSLRMIIDSLDQKKYKIVLITNPGLTFLQIMKEIIGQITGKQCDLTRKVDLLETFNKLLFETIDEGRKVLVFIDEANAIAPVNLEKLRLLTNMQDDHMNLFAMVLAGQTELAQRLEHPRRANLFQRIGTYNMIDKIQSEELVKTYVETRLELSGGKAKIFSDDAYASLWQHSEYGVPRLVNKICKLCLKAGETNEFNHINEKVVDQIGQRFQRLTGPALQKRKPRKRPAEDAIQEQIRETRHEPKEALADHENENTGAIIEELKPVELLIPVEETAFVVMGGSEKKEEFEPVTEPLDLVEASSLSDEVDLKREKSTELKEPMPVLEKLEPEELSKPPDKTAVAKEESMMEVEIGDMRIKVSLSLSIIKQAQSSTQKHRVKLAGALAAQTLQQHPQLMSANLSDPVYIWGEIREFVLDRFGEKSKVSII